MEDKQGEQIAEDSNSEALEAENSESDDAEEVDATASEDHKSNNGKGGGAPSNKGTANSNTKGTSKSYLQLIHEAIVAMKNRTGSSQVAIQKYMLNNYPLLISGATTPARFKARITASIKTGLKAGRFQKVKASFKINAAWRKQQEKAARRKKQLEIQRKAILKKQEAQKEEVKKGDPLTQKILALEEKDPDSAELKKLRDQKRSKEEAEVRKKKIAERLRKRRFPMEDTKLHLEDKELGVKPPKDVLPQPPLPPFFSIVHKDEEKQPNKYISMASKCDNPVHGNKGLVSDVLQIYHFFRGDVHFQGDDPDDPLVPAFTLKHLIFAVDDILNGTCKRARQVPPLIVHLFITCLQILTSSPSKGAASEGKRSLRQLQEDFSTHLSVAISTASWADVCFLYMDAMERYFTSEASWDRNVLLNAPIDVEFLLCMKDEESFLEPSTTALPEGYCGYLGDNEGSLARAHRKLAKQDPWLLSAEELMALLAALTDDILATKPAISEDISSREEKMYDLLKAKRAADYRFRKVRTAFEGPKKPKKSTSASESRNTEDPENMKENVSEDHKKTLEDAQDEKEKSKQEEEWKPTATKKQFETAKRQQEKANDAYEKGVRQLMARTEPVGYDRNFSSVYCFRNDPECLYVEFIKGPASGGIELPDNLYMNRTSWHVIEAKSLFDRYVESLDIRGKRENALYDELMGPQGAQQSLRRYLYDDIKERAMASARLKEAEDLKRRLENAKLKCDEEEGRRSGRLASKAEEELAQVEDEMSRLERKINTDTVPTPLDYVELTGLELLRKHDAVGGVKTRRTREKRALSKEKKVPSLVCSQLYGTSNIDGTGLMGMLVSKLLDLEERCESLAEWERCDVSRKNWIADLENLVLMWNSSSPVLVGPPSAHGTTAQPEQWESPSEVSSDTRSKKRRQSASSPSNSKRKRLEGASSQATGATVHQIVTKLKQPLLDLENRVFGITGLSMAAKDSAIADDNMSTDGDDDEDQRVESENMKKRAWKKILHKLHSLPSKRHSKIRELLVDAMAAARKAKLRVVVSELRSALLQFHPEAAGACKTAALEVLKKHGGYDESADEDEENDEEEDPVDETMEADEPEIPSALSAEAVIANSSLDGIEDAGHEDWRNAVRSAKTVSRIGTLLSTFVDKATGKLSKVELERSSLLTAIDVWKKEEERKSRAKAKKPQASRDDEPDISEVWANTKFSDEICMAKVDDYPWWPCKKCYAKDVDLAMSIKSLDRCLVSLIGESGSLRIVRTSSIKPFEGSAQQEDLEDITKSMRVQLGDCMAMARRIVRGKSNGVLDCTEEKKVTS